MARISISCNDGFLFAALGYSIVLLIIKWSKYSSCDYPLQLFLIIDYFTVIAFRCSHFLMQYVHENPRHRKMALFLKIGVIYVFFTIWTIVGTVWFSLCGSCLPENNQYWTFVVWLVLSYIWILLYACLLGLSYFIGHGDFNNWANENQFALNLIPREEHVGLTQEQINTIESSQATAEDSVKTCSICLEPFTVGEPIRSLPNCGHIFHSDEIDNWLSRKNSCPNCRVSVLAPVVTDQRAVRPNGASSDQDAHLLV